ncbi:MAG: hypothetical protein KDE54_22090, partial [Caldilineaceae bacterium]|nr:hypothetical protein [Caldilineaceae bacterium]
DFEYNRNLFDAATVQRIAGHFESLLRALLATPNEPVATLPLLTASERTRLLVDWNETSVPFEARAGYHQLFERQVAKTPNAVAVRFEAQVLTYAELNQMANSIAHQLQEAG